MTYVFSGFQLLVAGGWLLVGAFLLYLLIEFALNTKFLRLNTEDEYKKWKEDCG